MGNDYSIEDGYQQTCRHEWEQIEDGTNEPPVLCAICGAPGPRPGITTAACGTLHELHARWMQDPEYSSAYRWVQFWWPLTSRIESTRYWLAYGLARLALWIWEDGAEDAVIDRSLDEAVEEMPDG
jgi:hypothetical protein